MNLKDWLEDGHLKEHKTSRQEIADLLEVANRDLADSQIQELSNDRKLATAYNAALQLANIPLRVAGYRGVGEGQHYWTFQSLEYTLNLSRDLIATLNQFRKKRNINDYEKAGKTSTKEITEMIKLAKYLQKEVTNWLKRNHPELA